MNRILNHSEHSKNVKIFSYIRLIIFVVALYLSFGINQAKALSNISTVSSSVYVVTDDGAGNGVIANVPQGITLSEFLSNLTKDHPGAEYDTFNMYDPISDLANSALGVIAEDGMGYTYYLLDSSPIASSINISGAGKTGQTLTGSYVYSDNDGDNEGAPTFQWYKNTGFTTTAILGATSNTYVVQTGDAGSLIYFAVTPVALTGSNLAIEKKSGALFIDEPPVASTVSISGQPSVGETLTGSYTYSNSYLSWTSIGPTQFSATRASQTQIVVGADDTLYAVYPEINGGGTAVGGVAKKYNGTSWVDVGGIQYFYSGEIGHHPDISVNNAGVVYVTYDDGSGVYVSKFNGTSWEDVGTNPISVGTMYAGGNSFALLSFDPDDVPYLSYVDTSLGNKFIVKKFNGSAWVDVGTNPISAGNSNNQYLDASSGVPYIAYTDSALSSKLYVKKFNGSAWVDVGTNPVSNDSLVNVQIQVSSDGTPYISYTNTDQEWKLYVKKFNGSAWVDVGTNPVSEFDANAPSLVINSAGDLFVGYEDYPNYRLGADFAIESRLMVKKYDTIISDWVSLVVPSFFTSGADTTSFDVDSNGIPYFGYNDGNTNFGVNNNTNWFATAKKAVNNTDAEGVSTFQWYRDGVPISGATSLTYNVLNEDQNKSITFAVTPVAATGTTTGTTVTSSGVNVPAIVPQWSGTVPIIYPSQIQNNTSSVNLEQNQIVTQEPIVVTVPPQNNTEIKCGNKILDTHKLGDRKDEIKELQKLLNCHGFLLGTEGPGSPGSETNFFGRLTFNAVVKLQDAFAADILIPLGLKKGTGFFGPSTRAYVNNVLLK